MARRTQRSTMVVMAQCLCLMLVVQLINHFSDGYLRYFGIYPRDWASLPYIITAPFIHGSWAHLLNNAVGFLIFSTLCAVRGARFYIHASLIIILLGGALVWGLGRPAVHIGASGWVFGLWSLCIALAWFERSVVNCLVALVVVLLYGGMIWGLLPSDPGVSFEGHLAGAFAGMVAAATLGKRYRKLRWM